MSTTDIEVDLVNTAVVHVSVLPGCCDASPSAAATVHSIILDLSDGLPHTIDHYLGTMDVVVQCWVAGFLAGFQIRVVDENRVEVQGSVDDDLLAVRVVTVGRLVI